jgi:two-component system cell cycle response regulator CtrA
MEHDEGRHKMKLLVVSQSGEGADKTIKELQTKGFVVNHYQPDQDSKAAIRSDDGLAILLGPDLRKTDPCSLIRGLRSTGEDRPILVFASDNLYSQRVALFKAGADDVFPFSCDPQEISVRIRTVVRRARGFSKSEIQIGDITLDLNERCVYVHDKKIKITRKEYQILELLAMNRGKLVLKEKILNHLYDYNFAPDQKIIDVYICKLRRKLQKGKAEKIISTVWGGGYIISDERIPAAESTQISQASPLEATSSF